MAAGAPGTYYFKLLSIPFPPAVNPSTPNPLVASTWAFSPVTKHR